MDIETSSPAAGWSSSAALSAPVLRVLLLDDCSYDRARLRRICKSLEVPVIVHEVACIEAFAALVADVSYDLVILDCRLPIGSGFDGLRVLKTSRKCRHARVLMTSQVRSLALESKADAEGADAFWEKAAITQDGLHDLLWGSAPFRSVGDPESSMVRTRRSLHS